MTIGTASIIAGLSLMPGVSPNNTWWNIPFLDKIGHFIVYAIFARILLRLFETIYTGKNALTKQIFWTFITAASYGILMEVLQQFVPERTYSCADIFANVLGICAMLIMSYYPEGMIKIIPARTKK